eukprot:31777-Rhodomonas_salina.1
MPHAHQIRPSDSHKRHETTGSVRLARGSHREHVGLAGTTPVRGGANDLQVARHLRSTSAANANPRKILSHFRWVSLAFARSPAQRQVRFQGACRGSAACLREPGEQARVLAVPGTEGVRTRRSELGGCQDNGRFLQGCGGPHPRFQRFTDHAQCPRGHPHPDVATRIASEMLRVTRRMSTSLPLK